MDARQHQRLNAQRARLAAALDASTGPDREALQRMIDSLDRMKSTPAPHQPRPEIEGLQPIAAVAVPKNRELRIGKREVNGSTELLVYLYRRHPKSGQMERTLNGMRLEPAMLPALIDALMLAQQHLPAEVKA